VTDRDLDAVTTARLLVRPPRETDRPRFIELFCGYRPVPESRGRGCATEASRALLSRARRTYAGELLAIIAPENLASQNVCRKLGFTFWKQAPVDGDLRNLYTLQFSPDSRWD
jgi:RimJ/RimL family protein N-acetyltransferase